jgi:nucleoside-diphosphate-sugar epimerase
MKILFIGGNSHIAKSILAENLFNEIFIISRNKKKIINFCNLNKVSTKITFLDYESFKNERFELIVNFASPGYPEDISSTKNNIIKFTKDINRRVIEYLLLNKKTKYIFISSGIVNKNITKKDKQYFYYKSKLDIEKNNLSQKELRIYNLRIYSYISKFIDLNKNFFLSLIINSIKKNKKIKINNNDFTRDFIGPKELISFIKYVLKNDLEKCSIDISSNKFVTKKDLLKFFKKNYHLKYDLIKTISNDDLYTPVSKKIFLVNKTSLNIIKREIKNILN